ncbi:MAG: cupin domain-containing protein [Pseudomonadota bacterium]
MDQHFFNLNDAEGGIERELAPGITTRVYNGEHAMVSIVRFEPNIRGTLHHHPEEQWGLCVEGGGKRFQGEQVVDVSPGDFWRTPGGVPHTMEAGDAGLVVMDVFAPPRTAYTQPGSGFAAETAD